MSSENDQVVEQIKREKNIITKAKLLRFLTVDKELRIKDVSRMIGMKESYVCHILRLNKLDEMIVDGYYSKLISISHLFIISRLRTLDEIRLAYERVISENLTVLQTEELVRETLYEIKSEGEHVPKEETEKARKAVLGTFAGTDLKLIQTRIKSRLIFEIRAGLVVSTPIIRNIIKKLTSPTS
jgi:ParB family chromosome partitioning protein